VTADPTTPMQAVVQITLGQVYSEVTGMRAEVQGLSSAVRSALELGHDHETRIRSLEKRMYLATGVAGILGAGAGYAVTLWSSVH